MKKTFASFLAGLFHYTTLLALLWGVYAGKTSIIGMASVAIWIVILLGIFMVFFTLLIAFGASYLADQKKRQDGLEYLERFSKRRSIAARTWGWVMLITTAILLAYSGWAFTAVCYVMVSLLLRFCAVIARAGVAELKEPGQTIAAEPDRHHGERTSC